MGRRLIGGLIRSRRFEHLSGLAKRMLGGGVGRVRQHQESLAGLPNPMASAAARERKLPTAGGQTSRSPAGYSWQPKASASGHVVQQAATASNQYLTAGSDATLGAAVPRDASDGRTGSPRQGSRPAHPTWHKCVYAAGRTSTDAWTCQTIALIGRICVHGQIDIIRPMREALGACSC